MLSTQDANSVRQAGVSGMFQGKLPVPGWSGITTCIFRSNDYVPIIEELSGHI